MPWRTWFELALLISTVNLVEAACIDGFGSANGSLSAMMQQAAIPMTLLITCAALGRRYSRVHVLAATLVGAGVAAAYAPIAPS